MVVGYQILVGHILVQQNLNVLDDVYSLIA